MIRRKRKSIRIYAVNPFLFLDTRYLIISSKDIDLNYKNIARSITASPRSAFNLMSYTLLRTSMNFSLKSLDNISDKMNFMEPSLNSRLAFITPRLSDTFSIDDGIFDISIYHLFKNIPFLRSIVILQEYRIRPFGPEDLDEVERINRIFLPENYPSYFFIENYRRFPSSFLVAENDEGKVIGYVMCRVENYYTKKMTLLFGHVLSIAVSKKHRRRGVGRALMIRAEGGLKSYGADAIYLEVRVSNDPAILLYGGLGYRKLGAIHSYYADGEDAYLMYKIVGESIGDEAIWEALGKRVMSP